MATVHGAVAFAVDATFAVAGHKITHGTVTFPLTLSFGARGEGFSLTAKTPAALTLAPAAESVLVLG